MKCHQSKDAHASRLHKGLKLVLTPRRCTIPPLVCLCVQNQKAVIQAAIGKLTETCFDKCVQKPGNKLDSSEANCIANCAGRYLDSSVFVVNRMMAKRQQGQ